MTNNNPTRYAVIDVTSNKPMRVMGQLGIYITNAAQMRENGFTVREEADRLCALLNNGEVEYESGSFIVGTFNPIGVSLA